MPNEDTKSDSTLISAEDDARISTEDELLQAMLAPTHDAPKPTPAPAPPVPPTTASIDEPVSRAAPERATPPASPVAAPVAVSSTEDPAAADFDAAPDPTVLAEIADLIGGRWPAPASPEPAPAAVGANALAASTESAKAPTPASASPAAIPPNVAEPRPGPSSFAVAVTAQELNAVWDPETGPQHLATLLERAAKTGYEAAKSETDARIASIKAEILSQVPAIAAQMTLTQQELNSRLAGVLDANPMLKPLAVPIERTFVDPATKQTRKVLSPSPLSLMLDRIRMEAAAEGRVMTPAQIIDALPEYGASVARMAAAASAGRARRPVPPQPRPNGRGSPGASAKTPAYGDNDFLNGDPVAAELYERIRAQPR